MAKGKTKDTTKLPELVVPDEVKSEAKAQIQDLVTVAQAVEIQNDEQYAIAGDLLTGSIKPALKQLDDAFDPIVASWYAGHRQTLATKKALAAPLLEAEDRVKKLLGGYAVEQARVKRLAAAQAAEEEARVEREAQEAADAEEAVRLLEEGDEAGALELLGLDGGDDDGEFGPADTGEEVEPYVPPVKVKAPKAEGVTVRMLKRYRVTNELAIDRSYMVPDAQAIQADVDRLGKRAEAIVGGIEVYEVPSVGAQAR